MRQHLQRAARINGVLLSVSFAFATGSAAQAVPTERSVPPPVAESARGFTSITSVRELAGGRVLVADHGEDYLYLVDWDTGAIDQVSRQGEGPGEYESIGRLHIVDENETLLTDTGGRWILLRDTAIVETLTAVSPLNRRFRSYLDGVAVGGGVLASVNTESPGYLGAHEIVLELAPGLGSHEELPRLDTIRLVEGSGSDQIACVLASTRGAPRCRFLETEEQAILFPDGWIAVALQDPYRVDWRSPDGAWTRGEMLDDPVPLSEAEKCAAIFGWVETDSVCDEDAVERLVWQETIPPFLTGSATCLACDRLAAGEAPWLFADPRGRLVIRRTPHLSRRGNVYDIVDRTGRLVERVTLPRRQAIVGFGDSSVYTIRWDAYDLEWLRRHPWRD